MEGSSKWFRAWFPRAARLYIRLKHWTLLILEHRVPMYGMMRCSQNVRRLRLIAAPPDDEGPEPQPAASATVSFKGFLPFDDFLITWLGSPGLVLWMFNHQA
jgi:hypothetical protein